MVLRETEQDLKQSYLDDCKYRSKQQKALHLYHHPRTKYCPKNEFESQMGRKAMNLNVLIRQIWKAESQRLNLQNINAGMYKM